MKNNDTPKLKKHVDVVECAKMGMFDALLELIEKFNKDVNEIDESGYSAILCAAQRNDLNMMKMLVQHGACLDVETYGHTPIGYAKHYKNQDMIEFIQNLNLTLLPTAP